jgi:hypothetical protein
MILAQGSGLSFSTSQRFITLQITSAIVLFGMINARIQGYILLMVLTCHDLYFRNQ